MAKNIFKDFLWQLEGNRDGYTVTYRPLGFEIFVSKRLDNRFQIGNFIGNKFEVMKEIQRIAEETETNRKKYYKYFVILDDDDIEGYESETLYNKGDIVLLDNGEKGKIYRVRNNGQPC